MPGRPGGRREAPASFHEAQQVIRIMGHRVWFAQQDEPDLERFFGGLLRVEPGDLVGEDDRILHAPECAEIASPRAREPNRITCSGSTSSTMARTIRSRTSSVTWIIVPPRPGAFPALR